MKKKLLLVSALLASASTIANAQSTVFTPGFYVGAEAGYEKVKDQTAATASSLVSALGGSASVTQGTNMYDGRLFAGYKIIENIDAELGYTWTSTVTQNFAGVSRGGVAYSGSSNLSVNGADYSVLLRPNISTGFNNLFFRVGGTYLSQNTNANIATSIGTSASSSLNKSGSGYIVGLGYDYAVTKDIDVRAAYNYLGNIAGISNNYTNRFSIGVLAKF